MMRKTFILLQALAILIAILQYNVGAAGENEGNHCNRIVNSVFYPYLTARIPLTGSGVGEWQETAAGIKRARVRVHRRQIYRWCYRLPSWKVLFQIFVVILCAYGYRRARTTWFYCTEKIYHFRMSLKWVLFFTLMEYSSLVIEMLLMISGDIESNPGPGWDQEPRNVDDSPLGEVDLLDILEEVMSVAARWERIGRGFGIQPGRLEQIQSNNPGDCEKCLSDVLTCWLRRNYDVSQFGEPTWQIVVKVVAHPVAGDNCALALAIAERHSGPMQTTSQPAAKQKRLCDDQVHIQGPMQTPPQPAAKRRRLDGDQVETQGVQQMCVQSEAVLPAEMNKGEFDGIQRSSDCSIQAAPQPAAKRRRLGDDEIDTQGPLQTAPRPVVKRRKLGDYEMDAQATQLKPADLKDLKVALQGVAGYWVAIADQLGMRSQVVNIQTSPHNHYPADFLRDLLNRWINREDPLPTLEALCQALCDDAEIIGGAGVARKLKEMFQRQGGPIQAAQQPAAKRRRLGDDEIDTQGPMPAAPQSAAKRRRFDDDHFETQGMQQICVQSKMVPPEEKNKGNFDGVQQSSDCTTYQSYCSNIHNVYRGASFEESNSWPPMGRVKFINLAILKAEKLTVQCSADDIVSKKKRIGYVKLFDVLESGSKVLVEGRPGCGKTTLLNRISLDWAAGKILKGIELLILVPLRRFHSKAEVELDDMLQLYDTGHLCHSVGNQISLSGGKGVCIVLDGLDEYPRCSEPGNFVLELLKGSKLPSSVVIASSRPAAAHHFRQHATQRVEVLGFLRPEIQQYVQEHYEQDNDKLKALNIYLEHHPNIRHMCYLPLHLAMVVYLNDVLESGSLPHTETGVYDKFMLYTLLRDMQRGSQSSKEQLNDVKQLHPEKLKVFRNICSLAFSATVQSEQIFSRKDVEGVLGSTEFSLESLGLLTEDKLFCEHGLEETYSFAHLTFQEFLAAYHLTELSAAEQIEAVRKHVGEKHLEVVWKFYCGLTKLTGNVAMDVFRVLLQQDELNLLLLIHSIHESQNQMACRELLSSRNGALCISDKVLTPADMLAVAYCMRNASTSLTELSFQSCYLDREHLQVLTSECSYSLMNIKCLSLKKTLIRKKVVSSFVTFLRRFPNLESFEFPRFSRPPLAGDLAEAISSLKALKSLMLSGNLISDDGCAALSRGLPECRELQKLDVRDCSIGESGAIALVECLKSCINLQELSADSVVIRNGGGILQLLKAIPTLQTIRCCGSSLDLEVSKEFDKGALVRVFKGKKRTTLLSVQTSATYSLELSRAALCEADLHVFAELFQLCPRVQNLTLSCCSIGDSGAIALAESLKSCTSLQELNLPLNVFGVEGCAALSRGLKECRELKVLGLQCRSIGDSGAIALAESLRSCTSLQELNLRAGSIGDSGAIALAESLRSCTSLQYLGLGDNSLTDASIKSISEVITTVKSLKFLYLSGNNFTEGGKVQLRQAAQDRKSYPDFVKLRLGV